MSSVGASVEEPTTEYVSTRSDLALLAGERPPTKILTPAATLSSLRVDIAGHRFVLCGRVVGVGVANSNQILRHDFSFIL